MTVGSGCDDVTSIKDRLRGGRLGFQDRPIRDLAVPFDQGRNCAAAPDDGFEQHPHGIGDGAVVAVDQQRLVLIVLLPGMTGEVNLTNARKRKVSEILQRRETVIGGGNEHIIDVEQQAAPRPWSGATDEVRLAHC